MIDFSKLNKILFMPTLAKSIIHYRIDNYVKYMRQDADSTVAVFYLHDVPEDYNSWELQMDVPEVFKEIEDLASKADIIITQAVHTQKAIALLYAIKDKYGIPIYAEFDDDPYSLSSQHPNFDKLSPGSLSELWSDDLVQFADGIFTSTEYLKSRFIDKNKNVIVIPNGIDFDIWNELRNKRKNRIYDNKINIGWVGGGNHFEDLELIEKPIKNILAKNSNVVFTLVIGNEIPFYFRNHPQIITHDFRTWVNIEQYPQFLKNFHFDIMLAPLRDRLHNRAKSNLKWLESSTLHIPLIASPVEPYKNTTAIMADSDYEWEEAMQILINDESARTKLGNESYNVVKQEYDVKNISASYLIKIKEIIKENKHARHAVLSN